MLPVKELSKAVIQGLKDHLACPVVLANQTAHVPAYPYISFTVMTLASENKGTWGEYQDGKDRKLVKQTWSITALSDKNDESVALASKAHAWLDHRGRLYLADRNVIVQSVSPINNRDNILTVAYEYRNGFDVVFLLYDEVDRPIEETGYIETVDLIKMEES